MEKRNDRLAWAATAVGILSLFGSTWAQDLPQGVPNGGEELVAQQAMNVTRGRNKGSKTSMEMVANAPISDDGWSADLPNLRQVMIARNAGPEPVRVDVFNERGEVVEHIDWSDDAHTLKPVALDALLAGRYALRVVRGERSEVLRFRKD